MNTLVLPQCSVAGVASTESPDVAAAPGRAGRVRRMSWSRGCSVASAACGDHSKGGRQRSHQCFVWYTLLWP